MEQAYRKQVLFVRQGGHNLAFKFSSGCLCVIKRAGSGYMCSPKKILDLMPFESVSGAVLGKRWTLYCKNLQFNTFAHQWLLLLIAYQSADHCNRARCLA